HGEYKKLRHIINNASGSLRPLVEFLLGERLSADELRLFLAVLYYPRETIDYLKPSLVDPDRRREWVRRTLRLQFEIVRSLARSYRHDYVTGLFPIECRELFQELLVEDSKGRGPDYVNLMIDALTVHDNDLWIVRAASRLVRNLSVFETIVAGDLGDRGPRVDRVIGYLMQQPKVSFTWGNHDAEWMGACLGQEALIATVMRISLRYRRLSQLEEGFGVIAAPLEKLARTVYGDDPADLFKTKGVGLRDDLIMARMQKAISIIQFKLEGQASRRHPDWQMEHRNLLHRIDLKEGTVEIDGKVYPLRDKYLPTLNPDDPYALSVEEKACMDRLKESFLSSERLWEQMSFVVKHGTMWLRRDQAVIFHGCVPVDADGNDLPLSIDGVERKGRAMFDALELIVRRAFRKGREAAEEDKDWLWYLWTGPTSPLFGKDRMATFETYFVEDKQTQVETKNPYFKLIHDANFCNRICAEFGVEQDGLIVNGHVPVRVDKGEEPLKRGGNAITIHGAFSEAYGDRGYTLVLAPDRVDLAEHHHF